MIKKMVCGLALMGSALSSQAAVQGYDWSFTGFLPETWSERYPQSEYGSFDPGYQLKGRFFAEDRDLNGVFSLAEVTSFSINGYSLMGCTGGETCSLDEFSYTPGGALTFLAFESYEYGEYGSGWARTSTTYRARGIRTIYENDWSRDGESGIHRAVTAETRFAISPVPEPQTWLMLGAGIALLGALKRRRACQA